jgi:hypothetical protein
MPFASSYIAKHLNKVVGGLAFQRHRIFQRLFCHCHYLLLSDNHIILNKSATENA